MTSRKQTDRINNINLSSANYEVSIKDLLVQLAVDSN